VPLHLNAAQTKTLVRLAHGADAWARKRMYRLEAAFIDQSVVARRLDLRAESPVILALVWGT
jgi:hypothetical protein